MSTSPYILDALRDPVEFRKRVLVDTGRGGAQPFESAMDPWQRDDFVAMDNGWRKVLRLPIVAETPQFSRSFIERPRGHSKTTDQAIAILYATLASKTPLSGILAAADRDQGALLLSAMDRLVRMNPWMEKLVEVQRDRLVNHTTGSQAVAISNDYGSSFGQTPHYIIADELVHWPRRDLWDSLLSSAAKRQDSLLQVITNAGVIGSWSWELREAVRQSEDWYFSRLEGSRASWIDGRQLGEQRRLLPRKAYNRLWLNQWIAAGVGDAIEERDLEEAIKYTEAVSNDSVGYYGPYIASIDLAVRRDGCGLVVFGINLRGDRPRVAYCREWTAAQYGGRIPLELVRRECIRLSEFFRLEAIVYDPKEGEYLAERLAVESNVCMIRHPWTTKTHTDAALALIGAFRDRLIDLYDDEALLRDLRKISIIERQNRWSLVLPRDEHGHTDIGAAFVQGLLYCLDTRKTRLNIPRDEDDSRIVSPLLNS